MWKKGDVPEQERARSTDAMPHVVDPSAPSRATGQAVIGRSITIRGEVTGDENLVIEGRVDGSVTLDQHAVTIGPEGVVKANVLGRIVSIEGRVEGNVTGGEQVVLRKSSWVHGDLKAPRVVLEDGAQFRGGVLMGDDAAATAATNGRATVEPLHKKAASVGAPAHASDGGAARSALKTLEIKS